MRQLLDSLLAGRSLRCSEAEDLCLSLASGELDPALAGAILAALRAKGESASELAGFARGLVRRSRSIDLPQAWDAADLVGTGGDGSGSYNISTGAALVAAGAGLKVAKHGNRSISSRCGSADVLEALGARLPATAARARACFESSRFTFAFAPQFHPAMGHIAPVRRAMGVRTIFNLLGPLVNPARPGYLLIGAFSEPAADLIAGALSGLGLRRAFVVHGENGWDEPTPVSPFLLIDVRGGERRVERRDPQALGFARCDEGELRGGDAKTNARGLERVLEGERGAHRDALLLSAGLALELSGLALDAREGATRAAEAIDSGAAAEALGRFIRSSLDESTPRAAHA